jgi:hypothetical protein
MVRRSHEWNKWFAWKPVKLDDGMCHWLKMLNRRKPQKYVNYEAEVNDDPRLAITARQARVWNIQYNYEQTYWEYKV